jgi:tartrate dehydratase alpha subunit/fumarate hydratase class I-like protein
MDGEQLKQKWIAICTQRIEDLKKALQQAIDREDKDSIRFIIQLIRENKRIIGEKLD